MDFKLLLFGLLLTNSFANESYFYQNGQKLGLTPVESMSRSKTQIRYYMTDSGTKVGVTNQLMLKLQDDLSVNKYLIEFDLVLQKQLDKNLYLLKTKDKSYTLKIANALTHKEGVVYAHPNFIKKRVKR